MLSLFQSTEAHLHATKNLKEHKMPCGEKVWPTCFICCCLTRRTFHGKVMCSAEKAGKLTRRVILTLRQKQQCLTLCKIVMQLCTDSAGATSNFSSICVKVADL